MDQILQNKEKWVKTKEWLLGTKDRKRNFIELMNPYNDNTKNMKVSYNNWSQQKKAYIRI